MLHPSYTDLMKAVNGDVEEGETPVVNSRYSIVLATSKRARQIIAGEAPLVSAKGKKPLSMAIQELENGLVKIVSDEGEELDEQSAEEALLTQGAEAAELSENREEPELASEEQE